MKYYSTIILGGGFSGLFFASSFKKYNDSFLLIEKTKTNIGGYASLGGIKVGLFPAGRLTATYLSAISYSEVTNEFIHKYDQYFTEFNNNRNYKGIFRSLKNKYYDSIIIEHDNIKSLITSLRNKVESNIVYSDVVSIKVNPNNNYILHLKNGDIYYCSRLIIASGRNESLLSILKKAGEKFHLKRKILIGCRACFDPNTALSLFNYQHDFKVKSDTDFQTYCFNYRGALHKIKHLNTHYFVGSFNMRSKIGNTFIGKKINIDNFEEISSFLTYCTVSNQKLTNALQNIRDKEYKIGLQNFIKQLSLETGLKFTSFHFPALEQFWPRPILNLNSLESESIPNVYYIGDASGVSFGILQCFITAKAAIKEILLKK